MDQCEFCGGKSFTQLGILGELLHMRCRACGMNSTVNLADEPQDDSDDDSGEYDWVGRSRDCDRERFCAD